MVWERLHDGYWQAEGLDLTYVVRTRPKNDGWMAIAANVVGEGLSFDDAKSKCEDIESRYLSELYDRDEVA